MQCRICGNSDFRLIGPLCDNMSIMGPSFPQEKCEIVACPECGMVFNRYEHITQKCFDEYYVSSINKTVDYYNVYNHQLAEQYFEHIFRSVEDCIHPGSRILDVAGGYGELSSYFSKMGYANIDMLEIKPECIQRARNEGLTVLERNLLEVPPPPAYQEIYDLILCTHNLEHFIDFDKAMRNMCAALKRDGYLFIEVPDVEEYAKLARAPYHFLTYEHVCHFSSGAIRNLASRFGMQIVFSGKYVKCDDYPCLYCLLKRGSADKISDIVYDAAGERAMRKYMEKCEEDVKLSIRNFETEQTPLILWGIGASTAQLLNHNFDNCNVIQLVDSNRARQGIPFRTGKRVLRVDDPSNVQSREAVILILSTAYKASIKKSIRNYGYQNDIASL